MNSFLLHIAKSKKQKTLFLNEWFGIIEAKYNFAEEFVSTQLNYYSRSQKQIFYKLGDDVYIHLETFYAPDEGQKLANSIFQHYKDGKLKEYLGNYDGEIMFVLIDNANKKVLVSSDRFGMQPIYIYSDEHSIYLSSSPKFIFLNQGGLTIRKRSVECFLELGQLLGEHTWFEKIKLIASSKLVEISYNKEALKIQESYYWTWNTIKDSSLSFDKAVNETAESFHAAVRKRQTTKGDKSILLSGGMDSRLILSCLDKSEIKKNITVSKNISNELKVAKALSKEKGIPHDHLRLTSSNWINKRVENIWRLDAGFSFMHDHAAPFTQELANYKTSFYNGLGGPMIAGIYLKECNTRISPDQARSRWGNFWTETNIESPFYQIDKVEPYYLNNRQRRFSSFGIRTILPSKPLMPFIDKDFLSVLFSVDDRYRKDRKLYDSVALKLGNNLFSKYDYSKLLRPISAEKNTWHKFKGYYFYLLNKLFNLEFISYVNYKSWVKTIQKTIPLLLNQHSILSETLGENVGDSIKDHNVFMILRLMTLEIYFQQVLEGKLRTTENLKNLVT